MFSFRALSLRKPRVMESNFSIPLWLRLISVTSSANASVVTSTPFNLKPSPVCSRRSTNSSMTALKSRGEMGSPWRTP
ncbi:hypothetical protein T03_1722 [Trichinella britovi]|uniref:Uncharacterized protein n=1 Tax=Trichinella britovi TaxID=45882 RepID=A0A0V1C6D6_TRIBR|nr:hypothetical protein T03_1722 [Trichinella britovi]